MLEEINVLRTRPAVYVAHLQDYLKRTSGLGQLAIPGCEYAIQLDEGKAVIQEALAFLRKQKTKLEPLNWNAQLEMAANEHYEDIAPKGRTSHMSSDGVSTFKERIERHCSWGGAIFEAILYGLEKPQAKDVVLAWLIDDGFPKRPHRKNLMMPEHRHFALASGPHASATYCYIALFAAQIVGKQLEKKPETAGEPQAQIYR